MSPYEQYVFVTEQAVAEDPKWTLRDLVLFHGFNPNGMCAKRRALDVKVRDAVDERRAPAGAILAYGVGDRFSRETVSDMAMSVIDQKGALRRTKVHGAVGRLRLNIETVEAWLASVQGV